MAARRVVSTAGPMVDCLVESLVGSWADSKAEKLALTKVVMMVAQLVG